MQRGRDPAESSGRVRIERQRIEVGFSLLEVDLAGLSFTVRVCQQRSDRQLRQSNGRDQRFFGEDTRIAYPAKKDQCAGVEQA